MKKQFLLLAMLWAFPAHAAELANVRTVSVTGYAEAKLAPEQAVLFLNVRTENKQLAAGKQEQDKKMNRLMQILSEQGVAKEKVRTHYAAINPQYDYVQNGKPRFRAYELTNRVEITVDDTTKTGPLVDKLVEADFDRVENVQFQLKDEVKKREELLTAAIANAKSKAGRMAAELGMKLGKPVAITESGASSPPPMPMMAKAEMRMMAAQDAGGSMPSYTPAGLIEISQTVNASFELE